MFLSREDLKKLTGAKRPKEMLSWLRDRGYPHEVDLGGYPIVLTDVVRARLGAKEPPRAVPAGPHLEGLARGKKAKIELRTA